MTFRLCLLATLLLGPDSSNAFNSYLAGLREFNSVGGYPLESENEIRHVVGPDLMSLSEGEVTAFPTRSILASDTSFPVYDDAKLVRDTLQLLEDEMPGQVVDTDIADASGITEAFRVEDTMTTSTFESIHGLPATSVEVDENDILSSLSATPVSSMNPSLVAPIPLVKEKRSYSAFGKKKFRTPPLSTMTTEGYLNNLVCHSIPTVPSPIEIIEEHIIANSESLDQPSIFESGSQKSSETDATVSNSISSSSTRLRPRSKYVNFGTKPYTPPNNEIKHHSDYLSGLGSATFETSTPSCMQSTNIVTESNVEIAASSTQSDSSCNDLSSVTEDEQVMSSDYLNSISSGSTSLSPRTKYVNFGTKPVSAAVDNKILNSGYLSGLATATVKPRLFAVSQASHSVTSSDETTIVTSTQSTPPKNDFSNMVDVASKPQGESATSLTYLNSKSSFSKSLLPASKYVNFGVKPNFVADKAMSFDSGYLSSLTSTTGQPNLADHQTVTSSQSESSLIIQNVEDDFVPKPLDESVNSAHHGYAKLWMNGGVTKAFSSATIPYAVKNSTFTGFGTQQTSIPQSIGAAALDEEQLSTKNEEVAHVIIVDDSATIQPVQHAPLYKDKLVKSVTSAEAAWGSGKPINECEATSESFLVIAPEQRSGSSNGMDDISSRGASIETKSIETKVHPVIHSFSPKLWTLNQKALTPETSFTTSTSSKLYPGATIESMNDSTKAVESLTSRSSEPPSCLSLDATTAADEDANIYILESLSSSESLLMKTDSIQQNEASYTGFGVLHSGPEAKVVDEETLEQTASTFGSCLSSL